MAVPGSDFIVLDQNGERDTIYDFADGEDLIAVLGTDYTFDDLTISGNARNVYVKSDDGLITVRLKANVNDIEESVTLVFVDKCQHA